MRWYCAESNDSERWHYAGESREEAVCAALDLDTTGDVWWIAHENTEIDPYRAAAEWMRGHLNWLDEELAEECIVDPDGDLLLTEGWGTPEWVEGLRRYLRAFDADRGRVYEYRQITGAERVKREVG